MTERQKLTLGERIAQLQQFVKALRRLQKMVDRKKFFSEESVRRMIERYLQLALEAVLDISDQVINQEKFRKPKEYRDNIFILGEEGILSKAFTYKFAPAAGFRNILVHDYVKLDNKKVYAHFRNDVKDIEQFIRYILKYLKRL